MAPSPSSNATAQLEPRGNPTRNASIIAPVKRRRGVGEDSPESGKDSELQFYPSEAVPNAENLCSSAQAPRRRQAACQPCRLRKVKCDKSRPCCSVCKSSGSACEYPDDLADKLTLEAATRALSRQLDQVQKDVKYIKTAVVAQELSGKDETPRSESHRAPSPAPTTLEPSRDFLQIPPHRASADTVLEWEIFQGKYERNALISILFHSSNYSGSQVGGTLGPSIEGFSGTMGLKQLDDEQIPSLIDSFLQNVHTKNPVLDVESLVKHGRRCAVNGIGWDSLSCLVLLACALGSIAKPFSASTAQQPALASSSANCSTRVFAGELQQAELCFALACRRLGSLKPTVLGVQCYFFAGVYLMYTLRPVHSWQYFFHASVLYYVHLKTTRGVAGRHNETLDVQPPNSTDRKTRRIEQSLYWSCFKSECEFRVELPFPQSEISAGEYPNLFPSPPSPVATDNPNIPTSISLETSSIGSGLPAMDPLGRPDAYSHVNEEKQELRRHAKRLCREEESWYYYLTEVALRRIGNRIINTFFRQDRSSWLSIKPFLRMAQEFEAQVSSWSAHLPPPMQQYETTSAIRAPRLNSRSESIGGHVSRELSWAIDNRLLEMQTWLYQPFLYYLVHVGLDIPSPTSTAGYPYRARGIPGGHVRSSHINNLLNASLHPGPQETPSNPPNSSSDTANESSCVLDSEDLAVLRSLIVSGIECNLKTLDVRSHCHRHHGLWYDLRSIMCASVILLAIVKSGNAAWIPGGAETLWGTTSGTQYWPGRPAPIGGKIAKVLAQFAFWASESPDLVRCKEVLEEMVRDVRGL